MPDGLDFFKISITVPAIMNLIVFEIFDSVFYDKLSITFTDYENH